MTKSQAQAQAKKIEDEAVSQQADFGRLFGDLASNWNSVFVGSKLPVVDLDLLFATQRRNFEAFTAANRIAFEGVKAVAQRQAEIARETADAFGKIAKEIVAVQSPEAKLVKQAELAQAGYEQGVANAVELADMLQKTGEEALGLINKRVLAQFEEVKVALVKSAVKH